MKKIFFFTVYLISLNPVLSQNRTISGYIVDAASGECLINATVYEKSSGKGAISNTYGFYSILLPQGSHSLVYSYVGYAEMEITLNLEKDTNLLAELASVANLDEVTVYGNEVSKTGRSQMSMVDISVSAIEKIPVLFGEPDVLKVIQLLPGVQSGAEGTSGIYVRGGGPDQNLFLLDGVPVYNASHLFGFFSVFNPSSINAVQLYKGGFPARFGGRLSSVVDIRMKEGNNKKIRGEFSVGLISSRFTLEGPVKKNKTSFILSARRTYIDILAQPFLKVMNSQENTSDRGGYYFYDVNAKINHKFSDRSHAYYSVYLGLDKAYGGNTYAYVDNHIRYKEKDEVGLKWGNTTHVVRWNYVFNSKLFSNLALTYSKYRFNISEELSLVNTEDNTKEEDTFEYLSGIEDFTAGMYFDYYPGAGHSVKSGISYIRHTFKPGVNHIAYSSTTPGGLSPDIDTTYGNSLIGANELRFYIEDNITVSEKIKVNMGIHISGFLVQKENYVSFEPRISARYAGSEKWSLKASYSRMSQYIHLLSSATISLPTDLWLPSTNKVRPQHSHQIAVGGFMNISGGYDLSVEGFYKTMDNLIEYKEGSSFAGINKSWESKIETGSGRAYGFEIFLEKTKGKTTGWVGYTWSKSERRFENLNFGEVFPAKYDRRHDVSLVLTHAFNPKTDMGLTWVYGTGNATTLALQTYPSEDYFSREDFYSPSLEYYGGRNNFRMPSYHRLDVTVNFHKQKKYGTRTWSVGIYNAYNRQNPFFLYWGYEDISGHDEQEWVYEDSKPALKQVSLFPVIPFVSYTLKF